MSKRKPREVDRREIGMFLSKGQAGPWCHAIYEVTYSDGTVKTERGISIHAWAGLRDCNPWMVPKKEKELQKLTYRPDLGSIMEMMVIGWERLSSACYSADSYGNKPVKTKTITIGKKNRGK